MFKVNAKSEIQEKTNRKKFVSINNNEKEWKQSEFKVDKIKFSKL